MESIIAVDMKSFLFSNGLFSHHQLGFRSGHSTLEMLLLLSQQWMEALHIKHEIRPYLELFIQSGILPCSPKSLRMAFKANSTHGIRTEVVANSRSYHTLIANLWLSMESFHLLFLLMLKSTKALLWAQFGPNLHQWSLWLSGKSPLSIFWWFHPLPWYLSFFG